MDFFLIIKVVNNKMNVSIEILEFPLCVKNKILRIKHITKLNIEYIAGKNIVFNNSNLGLNKPIYSTQEVQNTYPEIEVNIVKENDVFQFDNVKVEVVKAIHGYNPNLKDGKEVFENVGYIIDNGSCRLYITSDTICFKNDYKADVVALPITAHGLTMSSCEASLFANELGAKLVLPIHMDNDAYPTDMEYMKYNFEKFNINYKILEIEEIIEI